MKSKTVKVKSFQKLLHPSFVRYHRIFNFLDTLMSIYLGRGGGFNTDFQAMHNSLKKYKFLITIVVEPAF